MRASLLALLLALAAAACGAAELGTLLTTPEERARLDRLRQGEPDPATGAVARRPSEVTGFVKRSDGRGTVWIDGVPVDVNARRAEPLMQPGAVRGARGDDARLKIERRPTG